MEIILGVGTNNKLYTRARLGSGWVNVPNSGSVIGATIMQDGSILGIGTNNQLYTRTTLDSGWVNVPNSGSVIGVTIMQDGSILGIGTNNQLYTRATLDSSWVNVPNSGSVIGVTIMQDGSILGIGTNNQLYTRATLDSSWVNVPNSGSVIGVTIMQDGSILGIGTNKQLYTRAKLDSDWVNVPDSGSVIGVAIMTELSGSFIGDVEILEKDFEPGETAILEFTFKNNTAFTRFKDVKILEVGGSFQQGDIELVDQMIEKDNLDPQETTKVQLVLKSTEHTEVGNYTVLPELIWTPESVDVPKQKPTDPQATFAISPR